MEESQGGEGEGLRCVRMVDMDFRIDFPTVHVSSSADMTHLIPIKLKT